MTIPTDAPAHDALEYQAQQLRMICERLHYVAALLPAASIDWRGPAQQGFDEGVLELRRDLAGANSFLESAALRTATAISQMSTRVG